MQIILCIFLSQAFGHLRGTMSVYISRFGTAPNFIEPWFFAQVLLWSGLSPDQILGTIYKTKFDLDSGTIRISSGPNWFYKQGQC